MQAETVNKRFMAKITLHHPYKVLTVLASKKLASEKNAKARQFILQPTSAELGMF
jgi:hypothetical protein